MNPASSKIVPIPTDVPVDVSRRHFMTTTLAAAALASAAGEVAVAESRQAAAAPSQTDSIESAKEMAKIQAIFKSDSPATWILTGDSITHGALHTLGWRSYPEHFAERVRWEMRRVRDIVINTGISGDRTGGLLADFEWRAARFQPTVVSIMLGMNDCSAGPAGQDEFRKNLAALVAATRKAGALSLLHTPNTILVENSPGRGDLPAYAQIAREVAAKEGAALVDHWKYWSTSRPNPSDLLPWIEDKSIHPGVLGHRAFAQEMFRALGIYAEDSPTCKLEI